MEVAMTDCRGPMPFLKDLITYLCLQLQMPLAFREKPRKGKAEAVFCGVFLMFVVFYFGFDCFGLDTQENT